MVVEDLLHRRKGGHGGGGSSGVGSSNDGGVGGGAGSGSSGGGIGGSLGSRNGSGGSIGDSLGDRCLLHAVELVDGIELHGGVLRGAASITVETLLNNILLAGDELLTLSIADDRVRNELVEESLGHRVLDETDRAANGVLEAPILAAQSAALVEKC